MAAEPGFATSYPFGNVGAARENYNKMKEAAATLRQIEEKATAELDLCSAEMARVMRALIHAIGGMFQDETMRTAVQIAASGGGRTSGATGSGEGIMEHKVVANLKAVNGDKTCLRQWRLKFATPLGQVKQEYEWMVNNVTTEIDLSRDLGAMLGNPELYKNASADIWRILIDKTEAEAYEKIKNPYRKEKD